MDPMLQAAKTWDNPRETLEQVEARIHDGAPRDKLHRRGDLRIAWMFSAFPFIRLPPNYSALEVGPGVGYLVQALDREYPAGRIIGLDVAPSMIAHAKERMLRDGLTEKPFSFEHYDGIKFPFRDNTFDFIYSVAAIQHIPKPFAYNIFLEATRVLKPTGFAAVHLLGEQALKHSQVPFEKEVQRQIKGETGHWHHFYTRRELEAVFRDGMQAPFVHVHEDERRLWVSWVKDVAAFRR